MTDTADLVKELDALFARATPGPWVPARRRGSWDWVVVQQSRRMNIEICQMFHDGTDFNEIGEANTRLICMLKTSWPAIRAALESTQKLETELAEAKRERDDALSERDACHTVMRDFRETIQPVIPNARRMFFFSIAEEILAQHQSAESSLAAAKERVKELEAEVKALRNPVTW